MTQKICRSCGSALTRAQLDAMRKTNCCPERAMTPGFRTGKPSDNVLLAILSERPDAMTYVIRNILRMNPYRFDVETPWVLRQMKRLEAAGEVKRVRTSYAVMICWALVKD